MDIKTYVKVKFKSNRYLYIDLKILEERLRYGNVVSFYDFCIDNNIKKEEIKVYSLHDIFTNDYFEIVNAIDNDFIFKIIQELDKINYATNLYSDNDILNKLKQQYRLSSDIKNRIVKR